MKSGKAKKNKALQQAKNARAIERKKAIKNGVWMRKPMVMRNKKAYNRQRAKDRRREEENYDD